jgi:hypothetical protein
MPGSLNLASNFSNGGIALICSIGFSKDSHNLKQGHLKKIIF